MCCTRATVENIIAGVAATSAAHGETKTPECQVIIYVRQRQARVDARAQKRQQR